MKFYEDEIYIKMCEQASYLFFGHKYDYGDFILIIKDDFGKQNKIVETIGANFANKDGKVFTEFHPYESLMVSHTNVICLIPRQDQLISILNLDGKVIELCLDKSIDFSWHRNGWAIGELGNDSVIYYDVHGFETLEKCLLAYAMKIIYKKEWSLELNDWININKRLSI